MYGLVLTYMILDLVYDGRTSSVASQAFYDLVTYIVGVRKHVGASVLNNNIIQSPDCLRLSLVFDINLL